MYSNGVWSGSIRISEVLLYPDYPLFEVMYTHIRIYQAAVPSWPGIEARMDYRSINFRCDINLLYNYYVLQYSFRPHPSNSNHAQIQSIPGLVDLALFSMLYIYVGTYWI